MCIKNDLFLYKKCVGTYLREKRPLNLYRPNRLWYHNGLGTFIIRTNSIGENMRRENENRFSAQPSAVGVRPFSGLRDFRSTYDSIGMDVDTTRVFQTIRRFSEKRTL